MTSTTAKILLEKPWSAYLGWVVFVLLLVVDGLVEVVSQLPGVGSVSFHMNRKEILEERKKVLRAYSLNLNVRNVNFLKWKCCVLCCNIRCTCITKHFKSWNLYLFNLFSYCCVSSLHWPFLVLFCVFFIQLYLCLFRTKEFLPPMELFLLTMMSLTESFNTSYYNSIVKKEQNERELFQWRTITDQAFINIICNSMYKTSWYHGQIWPCNDDHCLLIQICVTILD